MRKVMLVALLATTACATVEQPAEARRPKPLAPLFTIDGPAAKDESGGSQCFRISKSGNNGRSSIIGYRVIEATAIRPADFKLVDGTKTFTSTQTSWSVCAELVNDSNPEPTETYRVEIYGVSNARINEFYRETGTITDNDTATQTCWDGSVIPATSTCPDEPDDPTPEPPPPPPPPPPGGRDENEVTSEGDSISVYAVGNYTGLYDAARSGVSFCPLAVGGSDIGAVQSRLGAVRTCNSEVVTLLIGANDMYNGQLSVTLDMWLAKLWTYTDQLRAEGFKVAVGTILPQCCHTSTAFQTEFARRRPLANAAIRAAVGLHIDAVIDFAADSRFGDDADATDSSKYPDGLHPSATVQGYMAEVYAPVVDSLLGVAAPTPTPPPPPAPGGSVPTPSTGGLPPVDGGFDINLALLNNSTVVGSGAPDRVGAFRFICGAGQLSYDDPIVYPGEAGLGRSHLHQFYGNLAANGNSTFTSLRTTGDSTCNSTGTQNGSGRAANGSAYWMPAMLVGNQVWLPDYVSIYYKQRPKNDPVISNPPGTPVTPLTSTDQRFAQGIGVKLPHGLRFIFGYDMLTGTSPTGSLWYNCSGPGAVSGQYQTITTAMNNCPVGAQLGAVINAPDCWDNVNLDSPNHRSHVSYGSYGSWGYYKCPTTHPYVIPTFTMGAWYTVTTAIKNAFLANPASVRLSSDDMHPSEPKGKTFHADWFGAWDDTVLNMWWDNCINRFLNCSAGLMGNGKQLKAAAQPYYNGTPSWTHPNNLVAMPVDPTP